MDAQPLDTTDLSSNYSRYLPSTREAAVLDIGCGAGRVLGYLAGLGYRNLSGVDRDPAAAEQARRAAPGAEITITSDLLGYLRAREGRYDLVVAKDVLYYISKSDVSTYLEAIRSCLKPGGTLITENFNGAAFSGNFMAQKDFPIEWVPNEYSIRQLLTGAGFDVESSFALQLPTHGLLHALFQVAGVLWRLALRLIYLIERGRGVQNPTILTTKFVTIAKRSS